MIKYTSISKQVIKVLAASFICLPALASCDSLPAFVINLPIGGGRAEDAHQGPPGDAGEDGVDGLDCWDTNGNGDCDEGEDWRGSDSGSDWEIVGPDGFCDIWDCRGATGAAGADGETGVGNPGRDGADGADGEAGADGREGATGAQGPHGADGADGQDGSDGVDGQDGTDGSGPCPNGNPHGPCDP